MLKQLEATLFFIVIVLSAIQDISPAQYLLNPCPEYFKYEKDGLLTHGIIQVPPIQIGMNLRIYVELSLKAQLQNVSF